MDGGAFVSLIPPTRAQRVAGPSGIKLSAANGSDIPCYGSSQLKIQLGSNTYDFVFTIADVSQPILGADFLAANYLAPNHRDGNLISLHDMTTIDARVASDATHSVRRVDRGKATMKQ